MDLKHANHAQYLSSVAEFKQFSKEESAKIPPKQRKKKKKKKLTEASYYH